jgi:hypothetical protein
MPLATLPPKAGQRAVFAIDGARRPIYVTRDTGSGNNRRITRQKPRYSITLQEGEK